MSPVRAFAVIALSLGCVSCAVTQERAVRVALRELADHKVSLPPHYTTRVADWHASVEADPDYELWHVEFGVPGRKEPLYSVSVERRFGTAYGFTDYRTLSKAESVHDL